MTKKNMVTAAFIAAGYLLVDLLMKAGIIDSYIFLNLVNIGLNIILR